METTRGIILIHSAPAALCPHIEWALGAAMGTPLRLDWIDQPAEPHSLRAEYSWAGRTGTGAAIASALTRCQRARFEVTEEPCGSAEGMRWSYTPRLGIHAASIGIHGDVMVHEERLKQAIVTEALGGRTLVATLTELLGSEWDDELEAFRHAAEGTPVRWLHRVG